jgi:hypothetical protein
MSSFLFKLRVKFNTSGIIKCIMEEVASIMDTGERLPQCHRLKALETE